jgi:hypothetical protein
MAMRSINKTQDGVGAARMAELLDPSGERAR